MRGNMNVFTVQVRNPPTSYFAQIMLIFGLNIFNYNLYVILKVGGIVAY